MKLALPRAAERGAEPAPCVRVCASERAGEREREKGRVNVHITISIQRISMQQEHASTGAMPGPSGGRPAALRRAASSRPHVHPPRARWHQTACLYIRAGIHECMCTCMNACTRASTHMYTHVHLHYNFRYAFDGIAQKRTQQ